MNFTKYLTTNSSQTTETEQKHCFLCKGVLSPKIKYNIEKTLTPASNITLKTLIQNVINDDLTVTTPVEVCHSCYCLLKDLDETQRKCKRICDKLCYYLGYSTDFKKEDAGFEKDYAVSDNEDTGALQLEDSEDVKNQYECGTCSKKFLSRGGLVSHIKAQHQKPKERNDKQSPENAFIKSELDDQNVDFKHEDCSSSNDNTDFAHGFSSDKGSEKPKKKRGRKKKHPDEVKPFKCNKCSKLWRTQGELKNHLLSHSTDRPFICEICGQAYKHKSALDVHVSMHNGISPYMCVHCNKCFTQRGGLQRHMPIHTGEFPYQCDLCGKRFAYHTSFTVHQLSHSGQKDYKCQVCGLALISNSHLKRHMRVHTGEKNYACPTCGKRFAERYNLVSHQKLHEGPGSSGSKAVRKKHKCQICGFGYERKQKLEEHMASEHQKVETSHMSDFRQLFLKTDEPFWPETHGDNRDTAKAY